MGGVRMDLKGYGRCQESGWIIKGTGGVRMDEKRYGRCQDG